ncbi:MAG: TetR/AcrR family transcriptional regulator [Rhodospirillales bacterium]
MGRRSDHTRDELYFMALDAAEAIIRDDGFPALTARKVASRIGYAPGTLYNIFRNQDELILHLNARTLERLDAELRAVPVTGRPEADLAALTTAYVRFIAGNATLWQVLFDHRLAGGEDLPAWYQAQVEQMMALVENALAPLFPMAGNASGRDAARLFWSAIHGVCSLAIGGKLGIVTSMPLDEAVARLTAILLAGMRSEN